MITSGTRAAAGPSLLGDVGGTHVRLGWQAAGGGAIEQVGVMRCDEYAALGDCIAAYLDQLFKAGRQRPTQAALGVATPVVDDRIRMTNRGWAFSIAGLRAQLGLDRLVVLNDFTALALAIPALPQPELWPCGGIPGPRAAPIALLGPGTGLGVSGLIPAGPASPSGPQWIPLQTEGGHVGLAGQTDRECALIARLRGRYARVSAERVLSGPGLVNLVEVLCELDGAPPPGPLTPAGVLEQALARAHVQCAEALDLFCAFLGDVAGDLVLSLGARGGVYVGGGIVPRLGRERLMRSHFRSRFEAKGRMAPYMRDVPSYVIASRDPPALLGASRALHLRI